ncbi:retrovirus-related Pol polyprotein from transposon 412 [Trichonephila clavipes]|uniref:Retrovirus-related Pol polyprotein from transposon 412 n=1 Tax=Trichonephila clavipes TaxID=2585209 RepID=A0A8X6UT39_TRICX|nr:retrovirus-related Pol polyprotein from transposon 412 [Trichonephila clavipes]
MAFLGKGEKQDMLQLAEELGINVTLNMTVLSIKMAITNSEGYEEEFVKNLYETIIANGKRLEELERAEKMRLEELERAEKIRLEELVKEQALKEKELQLKFDLERFKIESGFRGSVNGHEIEILRDTGATIDLVCAKYINPSSFSGENVWVKQPLSPELVCLPLAVVEISGNFGTVQTKAAVCGNHLNQHGRYLLGNKTAELIKGNLGYNFLPVEILNAVQTRSQVKAAREERGIDSGEAKKGEDEAIIFSSDAEGEILIPALQKYDQGTSFTSALTTEFFERFGILVRHSSVYHPQSNPVERFHRTLKRLLRVLCLDAGSEWDKHLPSILLALRTVSHESTGYTPSELVYGKNLRTPWNIRWNRKKKVISSLNISLS